MRYVTRLLSLDSILKLELAKLHSVDLLSKCQEFDDKELKAWYNFFAAAIQTEDSPQDALSSFSKIYEGPKIDEAIDAELLFHTCVSMAVILSTICNDRREFSWPFSKPRQVTNSTHSSGALPLPVGHHAVGAQVYDRVSHLLRAGLDTSPLALCGLARRLLNIYSSESAHARLVRIHDSVIDNIDLGRRFSQMSKDTIPDASHENKFSYIDDLIESGGSVPIVNSLLSRAISAAIESKSGKSLWESLIRLSRLRLKQNQVAQSLLILDDIEEHVFADCGTFEWGLLFQTRSECLLQLTSSDSSEMLTDAFQNLQYAIACFDRAFSIPRLTRCVLLAVLVSNKLKANPFTNFYSVKASQIRTSMDCQFRFFPIEAQEENDVQNVMEYTGQPKLSFGKSANPGMSTNAVPASPVGRGMQTLIAWRQH